ncbi:MAG: tetraacyldisaccharide 4'-kinase, partial [Pseudomonadota bacterium]
MPAGPLREPMMQGLARADLVLLIGSPDQQTRAAARWPSLRSATRASLEPIQTGIDLAGQPVVAFAGIGRPEKFFETLRGLNAKLIATHSFPDHNVYGERVLARMQREAAQAGAMLVTTEKDAIKLPERYRREVLALPVRLELEDWSLVDSLIVRLLGQKNQSGTASLA